MGWANDGMGPVSYMAQRPSFSAPPIFILGAFTIITPYVLEVFKGPLGALKTGMIIAGVLIMIVGGAVMFSEGGQQ